ncbi:MAG: PQQ-dependent sugar dehydrogenase [Solirubrobacteraceae bacterium]
MRSLVAVLLAALLAAGCGGSDDDVTSVSGAAEGQGLRLVKVGSFAEPVYVTAPRTDKRRIYVVEQAGRIMVVENGKSRPFLDIRDKVTAGGEQGLLSVAFAPDFESTRRFYVYYTDEAGDQRVVEYRARSASRADEGSARLVLEMPDSESNHNGGLLLFGRDGSLYIGTGDGGGGGDAHGRFGNGQDLTSLLGKILRIDPRPGNAGAYGVPTDNPFYMAKGPRGEIYSYGLRNPWRFTFDRATNALVIGDVGQSAQEEVDYVRAGDGAGANFGWRVFEGSSRYASGEEAPGHVPPVMTFSHDDGNCSITGGVVVRDKRVRGAFGRYVFGDFCKGDILSAKLALPKSTPRKTGLEVDQLSSFGEDGRGRVYVTSLSGPVYRLAAR